MKTFFTLLEQFMFLKPQIKEESKNNRIVIEVILLCDNCNAGMT